MLLASLAAGCHTAPKSTPTPIEALGKAHGLESLRSSDALSGDLHIVLEKQRFDARFTADLRSDRFRMQLADDTIIVYDGKDIWISPAASTLKDARFISRNWLSFVMIPFKVAAGSANVGPFEKQTLAGHEYDAAKVTFNPTQRDWPDDWFRIFIDPKTHYLSAMAFVLTYGKTVDEANLYPKAVTFYDYKNQDGVFFPTTWRFWTYHAKEGLFGPPIGEGRLYNLEFAKPKSTTYTPPPGARKE
jgi:hypothetical protein